MNKNERLKIKSWLRQLNQWEIPNEFLAAMSRHQHPYSDGRDHIRVMFAFLSEIEKVLSLPTKRATDRLRRPQKSKGIAKNARR